MHDTVLVHDEHSGAGQTDCALGIDLREVETERPLGEEDDVSLLEGDADPIGYPSTRVGEDGEPQGGLSTVESDSSGDCGLMATKRAPRAPSWGRSSSW